MSRPLTPLLLFCALLASGCSETVGFLTVELEVPELTPPIECDGDPRRASTMRFFLECDGQEIERSFAVGEARASLSGVPLESCLLRVEVENNHGRLLYRGESTVDLEAGDVGPITISLTEEECTKSSCDGDGDGVADSDEAALGIDPDLADSDGDGLQDGVELAICCSDPSTYATEGCALAIQWVAPILGKSGDAFALGTTAPFSSPTVTLGGEVVPQGPISYQNTTLFFGQVPPNAVLGAISLRSGAGVEASYSMPFSVLRTAPETVLKLDQSIPEVRVPMTVAFDSAAHGRDLFLLGATGTDVHSLLPSVLRFRYEASGQRSLQRLALKASDTITPRTPIGIDARGGLVAALVYENATPHLYTARTAADGAMTLDSMALPINDALSLAVEPDGRHVLVVRARGLMRVDPAANTGAASPSATIPNSLGLHCTGGDIFRDQGGSYAFLSCYSCPLQEGSEAPACPQRAALFRYGPMERCLESARSDCWASFPLPQQEDTSIGAPVVDSPTVARSGAPRLAHVFFLTKRSGVFAVPALAPHDTPPTLVMPLRAGINPFTRHPMRVDSQRGMLYVLDGSKLHRIDLATKRPVAPAPIGQAGEFATSLALPGAGSVLAVTRALPQLPMELLHICVERCALEEGCVCQ